MAQAALIVPPNITPPQPNVSALARQYGVDRRTIRRWRAKGWAPVAPDAIKILPKDQSVPTAAQGSGRTLATLLIIVAIGIAGLALVINAQTGWHFGTTPLAATTFAAMATAGDLLAIVLPVPPLAYGTLTIASWPWPHGWCGQRRPASRCLPRLGSSSAT